LLDKVGVWLSGVIKKPVVDWLLLGG